MKELELVWNDWNIKPEWLERMPGLIGKSDPDYSKITILDFLTYKSTHKYLFLR